MQNFKEFLSKVKSWFIYALKAFVINFVRDKACAAIDKLKDWRADWKCIKEMAAECGVKRKPFDTRYKLKNRIIDKNMNGKNAFTKPKDKKP